MIPVFEPVIEQDEIDAVVGALKRGEISGSFGESIEKFESSFAAYVGCRYGIAVSSGSTALHVAVAAADIPRGSEILVSASTNIATALAAYHNNCVAVPVDSEPDTWNLNLELIESLITPKTRAIIPVHLFGHPVEMDRLMSIAKKRGITVIEDCAESHGATCRGKMTGSFGDMACFSFYANKIITTGEGGMITTNDAKLAERLRLLRNLAFQKPRFYHEHPGYNFRMTGMQAAMGLAQLKKIDRFIEGKRAMSQNYNKALKDVNQLQLPCEKEWARNVYWMYGVQIKDTSRVTRDQLMSILQESGIETRTFFCPMGQQPFLKQQQGYRSIECPVADRLWETGLYLPSSVTLTQDQIGFISEKIRAAFRSA